MDYIFFKKLLYLVLWLLFSINVKDTINYQRVKLNCILKRIIKNIFVTFYYIIRIKINIDLILQFIELSIIVGLYYDEVKTFLSSKDRDRRFDFFKVYFYSL